MGIRWGAALPGPRATQPGHLTEVSSYHTSAFSTFTVQPEPVTSKPFHHPGETPPHQPTLPCTPSLPPVRSYVLDMSLCSGFSRRAHFLGLSLPYRAQDCLPFQGFIVFHWEVDQVWFPISGHWGVSTSGCCGN